MLTIPQSGCGRLGFKLRQPGSTAPSPFHCLTMARTDVWSLHPSESPVEAEATGPFLDEEPIAPRLINESGGRGRRPTGAGERHQAGQVGHCRACNQLTRPTSSYTKHQLHGTLFLAQPCTQPAGTLKEGASQALVPILLQARVL